jgi:hypothetical protein
LRPFSGSSTILFESTVFCSVADRVSTWAAVASTVTVSCTLPSSRAAETLTFDFERAGRADVRVAGSTLVSGRLMTGFRDFTLPEITVRAARQAYEGAGIGPAEIDVAEVHDAFTIAELLYYEALGLCPRGEAMALLESGASSVGGRIPVNPSGGLLAKGHPVGATGVAQIVEIVRQLRGCCGARNVHHRGRATLEREPRYLRRQRRWNSSRRAQELPDLWRTRRRRFKTPRPRFQNRSSQESLRFHYRWPRHSQVRRN